jgi:hypothetical protein
VADIVSAGEFRKRLASTFGPADRLALLIVSVRFDLRRGLSGAAAPNDRAVISMRC